MDWVSIVIAVISTGILSELLNTFRNKKTRARLNDAEIALKNAEANEKRIANLERIIDNMRTELERMKIEASGFHTRLSDKDKLYLALSKEKELTDRINNDYTLVINCASLCENCEKGLCPVINKKIELDNKRAEKFKK